MTTGPTTGRRRGAGGRGGHQWQRRDRQDLLPERSASRQDARGRQGGDEADTRHIRAGEACRRRGSASVPPARALLAGHRPALGAPSGIGRVWSGAPAGFSGGELVAEEVHGGSGPETCSMTVKSVPSSALWIDGRDTGMKTPATIHKLSCSNHRLELRRPDGRIGYRELITLRPGVPLKLSRKLASKGRSKQQADVDVEDADRGVAGAGVDGARPRPG